MLNYSKEARVARNNYSIIHAFSVLLIPDEVSCIIDETSDENFF